MKQVRKILLCASILLLATHSTEAQFLKKLKKRTEKAAERAVIRKTEKKVYNETSKKMDTLLGNKKKKGVSKKDKNSSKPNINLDTTKVGNQEVEIWRNYKFIPGEKVIFYDDLKSEEVGEFPSRWDLAKGGAEVALFNGEKVIIGTSDYNRVFPLFDSIGYLSDEFTIEFDIYVGNLTEKNYMSWSDYSIFFDSKRIKSGSSGKSVEFRVNRKEVKGHASNSRFKLENVSSGKNEAWHHIAMSYYKGKFKMFYDDARIANIPNFSIEPDIFAIDFHAISHGEVKIHQAIKNIRIAHGGGQMYQRIISDGKYVTNGILFDSGKSQIKQQSMGIINKIHTVLLEKMDWEFEIIGHTDSDGNDESNLILSKQRAEAVKQLLIQKGIDATRLTATGKGEQEPLNKNNSVEEKANNRRVEFILKK